MLGAGIVIQRDPETVSNFAKVPFCISFAWPGFFSRRATGGGFGVKIPEASYSRDNAT